MMKKRYPWIAIVTLALAILSCQFLLPEEMPTPIAPLLGEPTVTSRPVEPTQTRSSQATPTRLPSTAPSGSLPSGLIRDPVTDADRATAQSLDRARPAIRDLRDLAIRLKGLPADTPQMTCTSSPNYPVGTTRTFHAQNQSTQQNFDVKTTLRYKNDVAYMWVADGVRASDSQIKQAADVFANKIYPTDRALLGNEASPGIDCDVHISILNTPGLGGAAGYVAGKDFVTKAVRPDSNEMEMFYMNTDVMNVGDAEYLSVAAHEFQHVIAENNHKNLDTWMNEGFSDLAIYLNGYDVGSHPLAFLAAPNTQLNAWDELERSIPHYGASFLFLTYFYNRFGTDGTKMLIADQSNGLAALNNTLAKLKPGMTVEDLFSDWQIANYLNDPKVGDGQYAYKDLKFNKPRVQRTIDRFPFTLDGTVNHWASEYFVLTGQRDVTVNLTGATKARLIATDPPSGKMMWYSGRGDNSDFTLTREFDLTGQSNATLKFQTWYDLEQDWDYAYVEASTDGGQTWKILKTPEGTDTNPNGNSYGWAYTGTSGGKNEAAWIDQSVDLKEFAGKKIMLRFEVITDDALNLPDLALQDIRIPEINYAYNADSGDGGWQAQGFVRMNNREPERYSVQLVSTGSDGTTQVKRLPLADDQTGHWDVPLSQLKNAVLVLSALARTTTEPALYQLEIR
jgi:immune inhibitor A